MKKGGKKKGGKKQQQPQKAKDAKPKKSSDVKSASVVKLTPAVEEHARKVLEGVVLEEESVDVSSRMTVEKAAKKYAEMYMQLLDHGFERPHIEQSMEALPTGCAAIDVAMDWLMLNVPAGELPKKFTDKMHLKGPVQIISKKPQEAEPDAAPVVSSDVKDSTDDFKSEEILKAKEDEKRRLEEEKRIENEKKDQGEKDAQRDWILQYMEQGSSSEDSIEEGLDPLADYDVWSDPREVNRRKEERKRGKLPLEARQKLIAEELFKVKQMAADAKAAKDKSRQKEAGGRIRELKSEMAEIGMTDEMAEALVKPESEDKETAAERNEEISASEDQEKIDPVQDLNLDEAEENSEEDFSFGFPGFDDEEETEPVQEVELEEPVNKSEENSNSIGEEDFDLGMGMFSGDIEWEASEIKAKPPQHEKEEIIPWGMKRVSRSQVKMVKPQKAVSQVEMHRLPKSVLSRHCQQQQWGQPSFEKLMEVSEGYRYSVSVEVRAKKKDKKKVQAGTRRFQVSSYQDGWATIQEAQNAAATVALIYLLPDQQLQHTLPSPYRELYIETQKEEAALVERAQGSEQDWDDFVERLAKQKFSAELSQKPDLGVGNVGQFLEENDSSDFQEASNERIISRDPQLDASLKRAMQNFHASRNGRDWCEKRSSLPVLQIREKLIEALRRKNAVVVCGDTGCGKTTQVPQYIFESACLNGEASGCSIVCTQPRRLAAVSVSQRVADEMGQAQPGKRGSLLGYHVRLDPAVSASTRINFCTTGILLRKLAGDRILQGISHVVVDEVHERTMQGDFLLAVLRDLVAFRESIGQPLKVVLMSATLDAGLFSNYFNCPVLNTEGRTFPVEHHFLEDVYSMTGYNLDPESPAAMRGYGRGDLKALHQKKAGTKDKASLVGSGWGDAHAEEENSFEILNPYYDPDQYRGWEMQVRRNLARVNEDRIDFEVLENLIMCIDDSYEEEGSILVFLPGMGEINQLHGMLSPRRQFDPYWLIRLHSSLTPEEQKRAFEIPPPGCRKVVISTNIAETSLTIPDVVFVIDSGKLKERRFDAGRGIAMLVEDWVAQASAKQRKGRAGRVRPGQCFSLYTRIRFEEHMKPFQKPEIMRMPLEEIILQVHSLKLGGSMDFMGKLVQPPENVAVRKALENLVAIGAIKVEKTGKETLTPLGKHLSNLPVDARIGKLLVWASCFGCLSPALTIAAALSGRSIFRTGPDQQDRAKIAMKKIAAPGSKTIASGQQSDHLMVVAAYDGWKHALSKGGWKMGKQYANERELHIPTLESVGELRMQFARVLAEDRLVQNDSGRGGYDASWVDSTDKPWNKHKCDPAVIRALLCAALYPNLAVMHESRSGGVAEWTDFKNSVSIHKSSINSGLKTKEVLHPYVAFLEKVKTHSLMLRDCTVVSPLSLMLFGGSLKIKHGEAVALVDNWIQVNVAGDVAVLMKKLRVALDGLISQKLEQPNKDFSDFDSQILSTLVSLLKDEAATAEKRL